MIGFGLFHHRLGDDETGRAIETPTQPTYDLSREAIKSFNNERDIPRFWLSWIDVASDPQLAVDDPWTKY